MQERGGGDDARRVLKGEEGAEQNSPSTWHELDDHRPFPLQRLLASFQSTASSIFDRFLNNTASSASGFSGSRGNSPWRMLLTAGGECRLTAHDVPRSDAKQWVSPVTGKVRVTGSGAEGGRIGDDRHRRCSVGAGLNPPTTGTRAGEEGGGKRGKWNASIKVGEMGGGFAR